MANLTLRIPKAAPLSTAEVDNNFIALNADNLLATKNSKPWVANTAYLVGEVLNVSNRFYLVTVAGTSSSTAPSHVGGIIANGTTQLQFITPSNYDARDVLNKLLTVDGSGSGLDADTLDGLNTSSALPSSVDKASIVSRDVFGNFSANSITANLVGNVTGTADNANTVDGLNPETDNVVSSIVARDSSGNFSANVITADLNGVASDADALNGRTEQQILESALANAVALSVALG